MLEEREKKGRRADREMNLKQNKNKKEKAWLGRFMRAQMPAQRDKRKQLGSIDCRQLAAVLSQVPNPLITADNCLDSCLHLTQLAGSGHE